jgi:hypothetical protein
MKGSSKVLLSQCERVVVAWLEGPLEAVDALVGPGSKVANQGGICRVRTPVRMAKDCQQQKHTNGGMPPRGLRHVECTVIRREQLHNNSACPSVGANMAVRHYF